MPSLTVPTARNADLSDLVDLLRKSHDLRHDVVVPATALRSVGGVLHVKGADVIDPEVEQRFQPTSVLDGHLGQRLGIPVDYLRKLRESRVDLFDANVNGWLQGGWLPEVEDLDLLDSAGPGSDYHFPADRRSFLLRTFREPGSNDVGIGRALLSPNFGITDNLDVLLAVLDGIRQGGIKIHIVGCDLTETRMVVRISAPEIKTLARRLLKDYRSPYGLTDAQWFRYAQAHGIEDARAGEPVVHAGIDISNSETGGGAVVIRPRFGVLACANGLVVEKGFRHVHLGSRLDDGVIQYSADTHQKNIELVTAQARDAVATYLSQDYLEGGVEKLSETAEVPVENPAKTIEVVSKALNFTQEQADGILDHFIKGGQVTAGGVLQAVTSFAQRVESPEVQWDLESSAVQAMERAAALQG